VVQQQTDTAEAIAARIASDQEGVAARRQLLVAGLTPEQIRQRLHCGAFIREFPGVYRVGHRAPNVRARYMAATLACGDGAVLARLSAIHLYQLIRGPSPMPEVIALTGRRIPGITTHRARHIDRRDVTRLGAIPITTVPRALVDVAAELALDALARACHEAGVKYGVTPRHVEQVLKRRPNSPGAAKLRAVMTGDAPLLLSELERAFLQLLREAVLPLPLTNKRTGSHYVDCRWPDHGLTVERGSYRFHNSRHSWEQDHARRREARARRDEFRTYTWFDVFEDPAPMLAELRELLSRAGRPLRG
jgi:hypothetical protein